MSEDNGAKLDRIEARLTSMENRQVQDSARIDLIWSEFLVGNQAGNPGKPEGRIHQLLAHDLLLFGNGKLGRLRLIQIEMIVLTVIVLGDGALRLIAML